MCTDAQLQKSCPSRPSRGCAWYTCRSAVPLCRPTPASEHSMDAGDRRRLCRVLSILYNRALPLLSVADIKPLNLDYSLFKTALPHMSHPIPKFSWAFEAVKPKKILLGLLPRRLAAASHFVHSFSKNTAYYLIFPGIKPYSSLSLSLSRLPSASLSFLMASSCRNFCRAKFGASYPGLQAACLHKGEHRGFSQLGQHLTSRTQAWRTASPRR